MIGEHSVALVRMVEMAIINRGRDYTRPRKLPSWPPCDSVGGFKVIAYFIIKIVILWPGRLFEELNSEIYYDISKRKLPKPNKTQFSAPTFGPALPTCASAESKGHLCPRDIMYHFTRTNKVQFWDDQSIGQYLVKLPQRVWWPDLRWSDFPEIMFCIFSVSPPYLQVAPSIAEG